MPLTSSVPKYYEDAYGSQNKMQNTGIGAGIGGIAGNALWNIFGGNENPSDAAQPYLDQMESTISPYYKPYIENGNQLMPYMQDQYKSLINNPMGMYNQVSQGYQQSPGYQWQQEQGMNAANNAAAAGGMIGSPQHQQQAATMTQGLANQDYWNYMSNALGSSSGMFGAGLNGMSGLNNMQYKTGYHASNELANSLGNSLLTQANNAYAGQQNENESEGGLFGSLGSMAGMVGSLFF
jgi:hypothetical protein